MSDFFKVVLAEDPTLPTAATKTTTNATEAATSFTTTEGATAPPRPTISPLTPLAVGEAGCLHASVSTIKRVAENVVDNAQPCRRSSRARTTCARYRDEQSPVRSRARRSPRCAKSQSQTKSHEKEKGKDRERAKGGVCKLPAKTAAKGREREKSREKENTPMKKSLVVKLNLPPEKLAKFNFDDGMKMRKEDAASGNNTCSSASSSRTLSVSPSASTAAAAAAEERRLECARALVDFASGCVGVEENTVLQKAVQKTAQCAVEEPVREKSLEVDDKEMEKEKERCKEEEEEMYEAARILLSFKQKDVVHEHTRAKSKWGI